MHLQFFHFRVSIHALPVMQYTKIFWKFDISWLQDYIEYIAPNLNLNLLCFVLLWLYHGFTLRWRYNERAGVSNHQPHDCLLNRLFRPRSKKTSKLRVTGLCAGNSPGTGEFPAQMTNNAENVSIWWRHHDYAHAIICPLSSDLLHWH